MSSTNILCPICFRSVDVKKFGDGWVGVCCQEIVYNSVLPPVTLIPENMAASTGIASKGLNLASNLRTIGLSR